ncbi:MAG TPA: FAD-binding oxidoreductase [Terriglobia bacterium]|nr:FAD-binding oxidoreductase [Terriglobia bacterium]
MASVLEQSLHELAAIAGEEGLVANPSACADYSIDGYAPQCVISPRSPEAVAAALQYAAQRDLAVIPCCNATMLSTGNPPRRYDIALSLREMNRVRACEPDDLTASVEPGVELNAFLQVLNRHRLWLPLDPPGSARATLGGLVATNRAGPLRLRYGAPRDMVVGMKIATPAGKVIKTGGRVVKNVAGYDLAKLLIGSYGTLGVIVEINFKLYPMPARRATCVCRNAGIEAAREFRRKLLNSPIDPMRMALLDSGGAGMAQPALDATGFEIWLEFGGSEAVLLRSMKTVQEISKALGLEACAIEDRLAEIAWNRISDFSSALHGQAGQVIVKAALPIGAVEDFVVLAREESGKAGSPLACVCQNGAGIVHVALLPQEPIASLPELVAQLRKAAIGKGGSLLIVRCPSEMKKQIDVWGPPGDDFVLMRKLKEVWDPKGTLSPGRFLGGL